MKANDTKVENFLEGKKQFVVPLFQRTYSWKEKDIEKLWKDLEETKADPKYVHFFGSFVTMPIPTGPGVPDEYIVIDGQQRLTTIFTLLAALRNQIIDLEPDYPNKDEIDEYYLINKFLPEFRYKLIPTLADRKILFTIIDEIDPLIDSDHMLFEVYNFFRDKFAQHKNIAELIEYRDALLARFLVVDIYLEKDDDPYLIFESLNGTGEPLTQADLVRNYLFMRLNPNDQVLQERYYNKFWYPMQQELQDNLEYFIRHYLSINGDLPNFNRIYTTFKDKYDVEAKTQEDIISLMEELHKFAQYYIKFVDPEEEDNKKLKVYFEKFKRLEVTTSYPLLLALYSAYKNSIINSDELNECLNTIEAFVVRRAVCGIPVNALNRYFPTIYGNLDQSDIKGSLKETFNNATGTRRMPESYAFKKCLREGNLTKKILRYLLEEIEKHPDNKELVELKTLQIEHIMPQTLSNKWKEQLGENWELIHKKYLENIGNITLTGYNPKYSNKTFEGKRDMENGFKNSGLQLNSYLADLEYWNDKEIKRRANNLSNKAIKIWSIE